MSVSENLLEVEARIQAACARAGRERSAITLIAASKFQDDAAVKEAYACGLRDFGENYVQDLTGRVQRLALKDARWHLIGHLQTNKVKAAMECADVFQALDSEKLLAALLKASRMRAQPWPVFIEVNIDTEAGKSGVAPRDAASLAEKTRAAGGLLLLHGLFCVPRADAGEAETRQAFGRLRALRDAIDPGLKLSMGMSADFEIAIEEGADLIRVGTKIFGERRKR